MGDFLGGMITMGFLTAALFFFKFWSRTRDFLFAAFGLTFVCFAITQALPVLLDVPKEGRSWVYVVRLVGFAILIAGIVAKNARSGQRQR